MIFGIAASPFVKNIIPHNKINITIFNTKFYDEF